MHCSIRGLFSFVIYSRLLKRLTKVLLGPSLVEPLGRLGFNTVVVLFLMIVAHAVCFVIVNSLLNAQHK